MLKKIWNWLVKSSVNAQRISLTVKGILIGIIPVVMTIAHLANIKVESADLTTLIDAMANLIIVLGSLVSIIAMIWGVIRKIFTTFNGTNAVLNS